MPAAKKAAKKPAIKKSAAKKAAKKEKKIKHTNFKMWPSFFQQRVGRYER